MPQAVIVHAGQLHLHPAGAECDRIAQELRFEARHDSLRIPIILVLEIGFGERAKQAVIADQVLRQANAARP